MRYKLAVSDPVFGRMLALEIERFGLEEADETSGWELLCAEGQTELPRSRRLAAAILVDCGLLAAAIPEPVKVLILERPFRIEELRNFVNDLLVSGCEPMKNVVDIYPDDYAVVYGNVEVRLTKREFEVFSYLYTRPYVTITRNELLHELWQDENARDTNVVDVYIKFLRTKLDDKFGIKLIRSKRGEGYTYAPDVKLAARAEKSTEE